VSSLLSSQLVSYKASNTESFSDFWFNNKLCKFGLVLTEIKFQTFKLWWKEKLILEVCDHFIFNGWGKALFAKATFPKIFLKRFFIHNSFLELSSSRRLFQCSSYSSSCGPAQSIKCSRATLKGKWIIDQIKTISTVQPFVEL
jgi:hypothetical protein